MSLKDAQLTRLSKRLTGYAISRGLSKADAEDCAQEAILVLAQKYPEKNEAEAVPLSFRIIRWKVTEHWRRKSSKWVSLDSGLEDADPDNRGFRGGSAENSYSHRSIEEIALLREAVYGTLADLGTKCRKLLLWHFEGLSGEEIARNAGLGSRNAAYVAISRCKKRFKEKYFALWGPSR